MSGQHELFDWSPAVRSTDPVTSFVADRRAAPLKAQHQATILAALVEPMTADELAAATGLNKVQVARRLPELQRAEAVRPVMTVIDGVPRTLTRPTPAGRPSRVWERCR